MSQKTLRDDEESKRKVTKKWNENSTAHALRYMYEYKLHILLGPVANDTIISNLQEVINKNGLKLSHLMSMISRFILGSPDTKKFNFSTACQIHRDSSLNLEWIQYNNIVSSRNQRDAGSFGARPFQADELLRTYTHGIHLYREDIF